MIDCVSLKKDQAVFGRLVSLTVGNQEQLSFSRKQMGRPNGLPTCLELNLFTLNFSVQQGSPLNANRTREQVTPIKDKDDLAKSYPDCFDGVRKFQGQYHITVDSSVFPVVHAQRRMPLSLRDDIKDELDDMVSRGIITKLKEGEPTAWVNSLVYRRKPNGKLRICLDPKDPNKAISREHHVIPTLEEILPKLSGAKYFSIVDAKFGYWNVSYTKNRAI